MKKFSIEKHFEKYLQLVNLNKETMSPVQLQETRRAFYGAWGQLLVMMREDVAALPEKMAIAALENMMQQVGDFWLKENGKSN